MNNENFSELKVKIYEVIISILAIVSVVFAILDMYGKVNNIMFILDNFIYFIFIVDYIVRFSISKDKKLFVKNNFLDLLALIPASSAFRIFRSFKIFRLFKLFRLAAVSGRFIKKCNRFFTTNGFQYIIALSAVLIFIGGALISYFESMNFSDGIWWAFVTATTVGYGDISPHTPAGRIVACVLMITGIGLIGSLTSTITSFFMHDTKSDTSNDRVNMTVVLFNELNDSEKELFKDMIK